MPLDHMQVADQDPFATPSQLAAGRDEDPARITGGRYRLPELIIETCPACAQVGRNEWCDTCYGQVSIRTGGQKKGGRQRVTTLVKAIGDARALDLWHQRQLLYGIVKRPDYFDLLCAIVSTTFDPVILKNELDRLSGLILAAAGADEGATLGTAFHGFTEAQDLGLMHYARKVWHGKIKNYRDGLQAQGLAVEPHYIERIVVVERYSLAGTLDRILADDVGGGFVIGDLKSQKKFWTWLEIAAQLAAYAMADAMWDRGKLCFVEMPAVSQDEAVVAWMPIIGDAFGDSARDTTSTGDRDGVDFFRVDLEKGRAALDLCWQVDRMRSEAKSKAQTWGLLRPAPVMAATEAFARRLDSVGTPAEGSAVWAEIVKAGMGEDAALLSLAAEVAGRFRGE